MKIAVIGSSIAGVVAAHALARQAEVTLFEAAPRLGGQADAHAILSGGRTYRVDSGPTVYNAACAPEFSAWMSELGVAVRAADVSLGVCNGATGVQYGTGSLAALFGRRRNLTSARFLTMLADLRRFHAEARTLAIDDRRTLEQYLAQRGYRPALVEDHLAPLCAAAWSLPVWSVLDLPVGQVAAAIAPSPLLRRAQPAWQVIDGGASGYRAAFSQQFRGHLATTDSVYAIARLPDQVAVTSRSGRHAFDAVVLACRSDRALALLQDPSPAEHEVLGAIRYQDTRIVVHSDPSVMPPQRSAWSTWNVLQDAGGAGCQVSCWLNRLQPLSDRQQFFLTRNPSRELTDVWSEHTHAVPMFTAAARRAQGRLDQISGVANTWYCGSYWGWGRPEDGFVSGMAVARALEAGRAARHGFGREPRAAGGAGR
jgi:uncharacterized protein